MKTINKEIKGVFDIELGSQFLKKHSGIQPSMLVHHSIKEPTNTIHPFKSCIVHVDPLTGQVYQIHSFLTFNEGSNEKTQTQLKETFSHLKNILLSKYDSSLVAESVSNKFILKAANRQLVLTLDRNSILLECSDQILMHNCYSLFVAY